MKYSLLFCALAFVAGSAQAQSLTTMYGSNNGGSAGGAVYFDAIVNSNALTVTGFDTNTDLTSGTFGFSVYTRSGSFSGFTNTTSGWTLAATGTGTAAGTDNPSSVVLDNTFMLAASSTTGIALVMGPETGHIYTNGDGTNQNYSNADLSLSLGSATNAPFTDPTFNPRVWNGTIYYSAVPEPTSMVALSLGALALLRRKRKA